MFPIIIRLTRNINQFRCIRCSRTLELLHNVRSRSLGLSSRKGLRDGTRIGSQIAQLVEDLSLANNSVDEIRVS